VSDFSFVACSLERHGQAILEILNEAIVNSTALYDYEPRDWAAMERWFAAKQAGGFPVIGVENAAGELLGFVTYGTFRAFPAYKYTVEHSIYVHYQHRGRGLGRRLLQQIIEVAIENEVHVLVGAIDATNEGSIHLHESAGFSYAGTLNQVGYKFDRWLDLAFYQLTLATPANPVAN